jgi:hypothetical protein
MGSVEGVGVGIVVSTKRGGYVSDDPVGETRQKGGTGRSTANEIGTYLTMQSKRLA